MIDNPYLPNTFGNAASGVGPYNTVQIYALNLINMSFAIGGVYFFINLLMGGYFYISAGSDKDAVQKATARIKNALIGIIILLSVFAIVWIVEALFGISITRPNIPNLI